MLLHAFPFSSAMWLGQREGLASHCRVITPDLRGFGGSRLGDDQPSLDAMADDVAELLDAEGIDRAVIGGQSMGGYVTMALCRRHPDRVRAVILADTKAAPDTPEAAANREKTAQRVLSGETLADTVPNLVGSTTLTSRPMVLGRIRGLVQSAPPDAVAWASRAMATRPDSFDTLRSLRVPALVLVGEEDRLTTPADAEAMRDALPTAHLEILPKAGHLSAIETPESFNHSLTDFLTRLQQL
ncbi:alpha/beta fold hydrolase [Acrocarpospora phusangensis]|uniref:alpha/beta fold hydrolase n=1 Tax=Acrocarpospora phusangensis TaxID=1070424 RepID=UPI001EF3AC5B|nr:alpha/beta hydrolase [Acrocarpospora phusangensis]